MRSAIALFTAACFSFTFTACDEPVQEPEEQFSTSLNEHFKAMKSIEAEMPAISDPVVESSEKDTTEEYYYTSITTRLQPDTMNKWF